MRGSRKPRLAVSVGIALAVASGLLYPLAQPGWGVWPLAGFCLSPLLIALYGRSGLTRAGLGWVMGTVGSAGTIGPTVYASATLFFGLDPLLSFALVVIVGQLFAAIPVAIFSWLCGDPSRAGPALAALRVGAAWTASELLRSVAFTGLPWTFLAHALTPVPALIQAASLGGAFLVSFWLAAFNAAAARAAGGPRRVAAVATLAFIALAVAGQAALPTPPRAGSSVPVLRARLVQGNVPEAWRGAVMGIGEALQRMVELTAQEGTSADLVVWPENAVSFLLPINDLPLQRATGQLAGVADYILMGAPRADGEDSTRFHNTAFLLEPGSGIVAHHDKVHLVPFAEYVPWPAAALGFEGPRYAAGAHPVVLQAGSTAIGALVCYEVIFPDISRDLVRDGAQVLVNISNDFWLGGPAGSEQHLAAAVFRAVEFGRPLLRATNTGISAAIDAHGRILVRLPTDRAEVVSVEVQPAAHLTPYAARGDLFAWLACAVAIGLTLADLRRPRTSTP